MSAPSERAMKMKQAKRRVTLDRIYDVLDVGVEARMVTNEMFAAPQLSAHTVGDYVRTFEEAGILTRRCEWLASSDNYRFGKRWHWTLQKPHAEAVAILDRIDEQELEAADRNFKAAISTKVAKSKEVRFTDGSAVRVVDGQPVEAISGPDAPSPFDVLRPYRRIVSEPYALVEAARQYRDRGSKIDSRINALLEEAADLGLKVDEDALRAAIVPVAHDERLETIVLALPYIEQLEAATARLLGQVEGLKEQVAELNKARLEISALRSQNQRLIAKQVAH